MFTRQRKGKTDFLFFTEKFFKSNLLLRLVFHSVRVCACEHSQNDRYCRPARSLLYYREHDAWRFHKELLWLHLNDITICEMGFKGTRASYWLHKCTHYYLCGMDLHVDGQKASERSKLTWTVSVLLFSSSVDAICTPSLDDPLFFFFFFDWTDSTASICSPLTVYLRFYKPEAHLLTKRLT